MSRYKKIGCSKCSGLFSSTVIKRHVDSCLGLKPCPVCSKPFPGKAATCSYGCSNKLFRSGEDNGNWKKDSYRSTCFEAHGKKCIVCGEVKIVAVHHVNEDHTDNRVENLVPLCPTHHQYMHSRYKSEIQDIVDNFVKKQLLVA